MLPALKRLSVAVVSGALVLGGALFTSACSGGPPPAKTAAVTPGEMPPKGDWSAEYYDVTVGRLILISEKGNVHGKWQRPRGDRWADLHGKVDGNLLKFDYTEYDTGAIGPNTSIKGKGYLVYKRPSGENVEDHVIGEFGRHDDETGDPIDGIKQKNKPPDLSSIGGTGASDIPGAGDWHENSQPGMPEPPAPP